MVAGVFLTLQGDIKVLRMFPESAEAGPAGFSPSQVTPAPAPAILKGSPGERLSSLRRFEPRKAFLVSVQAMSWVIDQSRHKENSFLVLLMIANHAKSDGTLSWPSVPTLAKEARCSEKTVQRVIKNLCESGELVIDREYGPKTTRSYSIPGVSGASKCPPSEGTKCRPRVDIDDTQGGHSRHANKEEPSLKQPSNTFPPELPNEQVLVLSPPSEEQLNGNHKKNGSSGDPRHTPFREKLERFWKYLNPEIEFAWSASEAGQLSTFLRRWQKLTLEEFHSWLDNYCHSEGIVETKTPREFLPFIHQYAKEPLNQFNKPIQEAKR